MSGKNDAKETKGREKSYGSPIQNLLSHEQEVVLVPAQRGEEKNVVHLSCSIW